MLKADWRGVIGNPCFTVPQNKRAATGLVCCPAPSFSTPNKRGEKALDIRTCSHPAIVLALPSSQATHERLPSTTVQFVGRRVALRRAVMSRAKHQSNETVTSASPALPSGHMATLKKIRTMSSPSHNCSSMCCNAIGYVFYASVVCCQYKPCSDIRISRRSKEWRSILRRPEAVPLLRSLEPFSPIFWDKVAL